MSFRSLKTDLDPRKFIIRRWKSIPKQKTYVNESEVNYRDCKGRTLLYFAARNGDTEAARQLLKGGCNPKLSDVNRNTPLHIATDGGHLEIIQLLIEYGCKINARNILGQTALMKAVQGDNIDTLAVLYNAGASLDFTDCTGKTALILALQDNNEEISSYLIRNGCDVNIADYLGQSALYTIVYSNDEIPMSLCKKIVQAGYNFEHDKEWMSKDLYRQLTEQPRGIVSRIKRRLSFKKTPNKSDNVSNMPSDDLEEVRSILV